MVSDGTIYVYRLMTLRSGVPVMRGFKDVTLAV
jgi:hypothetical protein